MKELSHKVKEKVIRLFVDGTPYNKISDQLDIAKGSVVNIIDDLREGRLSLPVDMTEHVSELRTLVIDLKKHQISVGQMKVYLKLHKKLKNMGVDCENVEEWVDIFQNIAGSNDSNDHFIETVYDLAQLSKEAGQDLREFVCEYEEKLATRAEIDNQMEEKKQQLQEIEPTVPKGHAGKTVNDSLWCLSFWRKTNKHSYICSSWNNADTLFTGNLAISQNNQTSPCLSSGDALEAKHIAVYLSLDY